MFSVLDGFVLFDSEMCSSIDPPPTLAAYSRGKNIKCSFCSVWRKFNPIKQAWKWNFIFYVKYLYRDFLFQQKSQGKDIPLTAASSSSFLLKTSPVTQVRTVCKLSCSLYWSLIGGIRASSSHFKFSYKLILCYTG